MLGLRAEIATIFCLILIIYKQDPSVDFLNNTLPILQSEINLFKWIYTFNVHQLYQKNTQKFLIAVSVKTLDGPSDTLTVSLRDMTFMDWSKAVNFISKGPFFNVRRSTVTTAGPSEPSFRIWNVQ